MNSESTTGRLKYLFSFLILAGVALGMPQHLAAQVPVDEYGQPLPALDDQGSDGSVQGIETLGAAELEDLVGPIALYPDDLLAIVLPASTYPLEIVQAARLLDDHATDSSLEPDASWDESVVALLNYPEVVYMMDEEIDWTWRLGEAVINQQADVLAAVESFRDRAYAAGNLESDDRQTVSNDDGYIQIEPVDEEIIYVPYYEPQEVVVYQPRRVYYYHPYAYPVYYYPYPVGYSFASGYFWGVTTAFTIGWRNHCVNVYHPSYWGHPYYGRHYYGHYFRRPSISVFNRWYAHNSYKQSSQRYRDGDRWRPRQQSGARPLNQRVRNYHNPPDERSRQRIATRSNDSVRQQVRSSDRSRIDADRSRRPVSNAPIQRSTTERAARINNAANNASRQRLTTRNTRENIATTRIRQNREANRRAQRQAPVQRTETTQNSSRRVISNPGSERARQPVQRSAPPRTNVATRTPARQAAQRQPQAVQRQTARPAAERQATAPARAAPASRQSQRAAPPANRSEIRRTRPRQK